MRSITHDKRGQVAPFLTLIAVVLILAIAATGLIGEAAFQRMRLSNTADNAVTSAASSLCRALNQIRQISLGSGGLLVHHVGLQTFLLSKFSTCPCNGASMWGWLFKGEPVFSGYFINSMIQSEELFSNAEDIADEAPKNLRLNLYEAAFGAGMVDEPKPFIDHNIPGQAGDPIIGRDAANNPIYGYYDSTDEVLNDSTGRVIGLNYDRYLARDSHFTTQWLAWRRATGNWYGNNIITYSYNKHHENVIGNGCEGYVDAMDPSAAVRSHQCSGQNYEAYYSVALSNVPSRVNVEPMPMILIYFWLKEIPIPYDDCYCVPVPGFLVNPWAWIREVSLDRDTFGMGLSKGLPFVNGRASNPGENMLGLGRNVTSQVSNEVEITGSVWTGFEPKMRR